METIALIITGLYSVLSLTTRLVKTNEAEELTSIVKWWWNFIFERTRKK